MRKSLLLTVVGTDRTGLVEALAQRVADAGGNWEQSRMARMAGQFAGIVLVTVEATRTDALIAELRSLDSLGLQIMARTIETPAPAITGERVQLQLTAADRPGIMRDVSKVLASRGVNVEELESEVGSAPMSGESLFTARALLTVPSGVALADVRAALEALGGELMVDVASAPD
jgi:glycine cleavage system regulatory protein